MNRLLTIIIVFMQVVFNVNAQSVKSDTLYTIDIDLQDFGHNKDAIIDQKIQELDSLTAYFSSIGNYDEAIRLGTELLQIMEKDSERDNNLYAVVLGSIARINFENGNYVETLRLYTKAKEVLEQDSERDDNVYAMMVWNLAVYNSLMGNSDEALRLYAMTCEVLENELERDDNLYATILSELAAYYYILGNANETLRLYTKAKEVLEQDPERDNKLYAKVLSELAAYYYMSGNSNEALLLDSKACQVLEKESERDNNLYATVLGSIARINSEKGNSEEAFRLYAMASQVLEKESERDNNLYATILKNFAQHCCKMDDYSKAIQYTTEAYQVLKKDSKRDNNLYATVLDDLAQYNYKMGIYIEAVHYATEACHIMENNPEKDDTLYVMMLNDLATYNAELGNYDEALRLDTEAYQILEMTSDKDNSLYAMILSDLALDNFHTYKNSEARRLICRALDIWLNTPDKSESRYVKVLYNIAKFEILDLYSDSNSTMRPHVEKYYSAYLFGSQARRLLEAMPQKGNPAYATVLCDLAYYNSLLGYNDEAFLLGSEALRIRQGLGKNHLDYATSLFEMAIFSYNNRDIPSLKMYADSCFYRYRHFIHNTFIDLTEYERSQFWEKHQLLFQKWMHNFAYKYPIAKLLDNGYNASLLSKGLLLNLSRSLSEIIQDSGDKEVLALYEELKNNRKTLQMLYEKPISERHLNTDSLENIANQQERELIKKSKVYGDYVKNLEIQWDDVQRALGTNDVAIEFVSFPLNADSTMYIAYVLQNDMKHPELVPLFEENQLKNIMNDYEHTVYEVYEHKRVSELVWQPLSKYLNGKSNIYFAPSGGLYNIGIENMPHWREDSLMSDKWNLYRLSSTRELAVVKDKTMMRHASVYGGINYDTNVETLEANSRKYSTKHNTDKIPYGLIASLRTRGFMDDLPYLPATKEEAEKINKSLEQNKIATKLTMGTEATESDFKNLSGKDFNLLHVASHGFYWTEREAKKYDLPFLMLDNKRTIYVEDKALCRSGLFLAGAKNVLRGDSLPDGVDDGVLTAKEISEMDLRNMGLVVLSACQTGLGEIMGDGIFGLQRGFKKAGAKTILMSLWKVDDLVTQMLMIEFYKNYCQGIDKGINKRESLRQAQKTVREYKDHNGKRIFEDPYYWAGFVMLD
ncbi:MAG: CHAT domain-containing protein [Lachnospiraceae bacterium]|nr:CHAT domain-containing protein [Lachnospiraceae bacterium]MBQ3784586.1 CHAT domain-containing protein [Lachnospiraceae bacterium]